MILNEHLTAIYADCVLYGAPNETITLTNLLTEKSEEYKLDSNGECIVEKLNHGVYNLLGSISKEVYPDGRLAFLDSTTASATKDQKIYKILKVYPDTTWFWFGREFGEWKCCQETPQSDPFAKETYYKDEELTNTCSIDKEKGCLKIYSQSSKKDKQYAWTGYIAKPMTPMGTGRICFLGNLGNSEIPSSIKYSVTAGLAQNNRDTSSSVLEPEYTFNLQASIEKERGIFEASTVRYPGTPFFPIVFIANSTSKDDKVIQVSAEIYAIWMDEFEATASGTTEEVTGNVYRDTLRSDIVLMRGTAWGPAAGTNISSENYFGRSKDWNGSGEDSNSSMAIPLQFSFPGNSKKLFYGMEFYYPYTDKTDWQCYWAITTNLEPYRAKDTHQAKNGIFPEVENDDQQLAKGLFVFNKSGVQTFEFPCTRIPKNKLFYLVFYSKVENKIGAAHGRGNFSAWVEYGADY